MKKQILLLVLLCLGIWSFSQDDTSTDQTKKTELKFNVFNFIVLNSLDGTAEFLINEESSFGVSLFVNLGDTDDIDFIRNFSITPYYRQFFSRRYAQGFFVEGFGMIVNREDNFFDDLGESEEDETTAALGVAVGGKFLTRGGFIAEIFLGVGRTLSSSDNFEGFVSRGGINLGYRF
ncbi:MAG: DUF3575 domain-containing protein [Bacteroidota bacterium]